MTYLEAAAIVLASTSCAIGLAYIVGRRLPVESRRRRHEHGAPVFQLFSILFSVLLAFTFSEVWGEYNIAAQASDAECGALQGAAVLAHVLPNAVGAPVVRSISAYVDTVIDDEWAAMARRHDDPRAEAAMQSLLEASSRLGATAAGASGNQVMALVAQAHAARETRLFQVGEGLPAPMWIVLTGLSLVLIYSIIFGGIEGRVHLVFAGAFTGGIVTVLMVVSLFDYPFEGSLALSNANFVHLRSQIAALPPGH